MNEPSNHLPSTCGSNATPRPGNIATWQYLRVGSGVLLTRRTRNHPVYGEWGGLAHVYGRQLSACGRSDSNLPKCGARIGGPYSCRTSGRRKPNARERRGTHTSAK